jgi:hypothetical protein
MFWSSMTYKSYGVHQWVICINIDDGARPAARGGGGRIGASSFPVRGRRTWGNKVHRSTGGVRGMLAPNSIWTEVGRRGVIDGGVELGFSPAAMATGVLQVRAMEGDEGVAGSLREDDVGLMVLLIGAERVCIDGSTGGRAAAEERGSPALRSSGSGEGKWDWITR